MPGERAKDGKAHIPAVARRRRSNLPREIGCMSRNRDCGGSDSPLGPALLANSLLSRAGEMYDARGRRPNRKSALNWNHLAEQMEVH